MNTVTVSLAWNIQWSAAPRGTTSYQRVPFYVYKVFWILSRAIFPIIMKQQCIARHLHIYILHCNLLLISCLTRAESALGADLHRLQGRMREGNMWLCVVRFVYQSFALHVNNISAMVWTLTGWQVSTCLKVWYENAAKSSTYRVWVAVLSFLVNPSVCDKASGEITIIFHQLSIANSKLPNVWHFDICWSKVNQLLDSSCVRQLPLCLTDRQWSIHLISTATVTHHRSVIMLWASLRGL